MKMFLINAASIPLAGVGIYLIIKQPVQALLGVITTGVFMFVGWKFVELARERDLECDKDSSPEHDLNV